jgi:hypothetical protein
VDDRQPYLEAGCRCQTFATPKSLHRNHTEWRIEQSNGAAVCVSFAASISASRPAAEGRDATGFFLGSSPESGQ